MNIHGFITNSMESGCVALILGVWAGTSLLVSARMPARRTRRTRRPAATTTGSMRVRGVSR